MNYIFILASMLLCFWTLPCFGQNQTWPEVTAQVLSEAHQIKQETAISKEIIKKERASLLQQLAQLKKAVLREENRFNQLKADFEALLKQEEKERAQLQKEEKETKSLEGIVRAAVRDANKLFQNSLISPEYQEHSHHIKFLAETKQFPSFEDIQTLVELLFSHIKASGQVRKSKGEFIGLKGTKVSGEILRVGDIVAFYREDGGYEIGFLRYDSKQNFLTALPCEISWSVSRAIRKYFDGGSDVLPLDISGGMVFERLSHSRGIKDWLLAGGFLVWPILLIGLIALVLVLERFFFLARLKANTDEIMQNFNSLFSQGLLNKCKELCEANAKAPVCRVLAAGLAHFGASRDVLENVLHEAILKEIPKLERFLPTLSVLAAIAPLMGLLGTVTGIINTFQVITFFGTSDPRMMSGGISEALITTQLGLAVAIPVMIMHHFLEQKVDRLVADMEEKSVTFIVSMMKAN
ncbi:MotA/TolQ/ExbB proton channel family protein [Desulfovulcanus sp.]